MKYGVLTYNKPVRPGSKNWCNLGDPIQSYAMIKLYEDMGISQENIIRINRYMTKSYDGDYVVLPFNCYNMVFNQYKHQFDTLPVSDKIIPVFTSFHLHSRRLDKDIIEQLRRFEPIGCRDEETMILLRNQDVRAYLSGCVTATLPRRKNAPKKGKNYFVDCPESIFKYVPKDIMENAEITTHLPYMPRSSESLYLTDEEERNYYNLGVNQLKLYENNANLIITSRLHVATPCMAMGIPVILVSENFDGRFSWIDKYLNLYTPNEFKEIDWYPSPVEYEEDKEIIKKQFIFRIRKAYEENEILYDCSSIYEKRKKAIYNDNLIKSIRCLSEKLPEKVKYAIWGLRADTLNFHHVIEDNFPLWKLEAVIDENSTGKYEGYPIMKSKDIPKLDKEIIYFVIPEAAHTFAAETLKNLNLKCILVKNKTSLIEL